MADTLTWNLQGVERLTRKLEALSFDVKKKGGRAALRRSANVVRDAVIASALRLDDLSTKEQIAKNVTVRWNGFLNKKTGDLGFRVGVLGGSRAPAESKQAAKTARRRAKAGQKSLDELGEIEGKGKGNPGGDTYYWRFVEFGTERTAARPFMRPALRSSTAQATDTFVAAFEKSIDRVLSKTQ